MIRNSNRSLSFIWRNLKINSKTVKRPSIPNTSIMPIHVMQYMFQVQKLSCMWNFYEHGGFYFVLCSFEWNIDAGKYLKNNTHSYLYIYIFFLIWQIIIGLSVYYVTVNLTLIQGKYLRKKKRIMFLLMWQIKS